MQEEQLGRLKRLISSALLIFGLSATVASTAFATPPLPTGGVCGFSLTLAMPFADTQGSNPGTNIGLTWLGTIDFGAGTIAFNVVLQNPASPQLTTESQAHVSVPFTSAAGPIAGSYTLSFTPSSNEWQFNLTPVKDGKVLLLQAWSPVAGNQAAAGFGQCRF